jgi:hypothetical protein
MLATSNVLAGMAARTAVVLALLFVTTACDTEPTRPSDTALNLTGTWRGNVTVAGIGTVMTWTLTQAASAVNGPVVIGVPTGIVLVNGILAGTLSGTTLTYSISVPPGGVNGQPGCSGLIAGSTNVATSTTMNGSYNLTSSTCSTGFTSGTFTLTKQ